IVSHGSAIAIIADAAIAAKRLLIWDMAPLPEVLIDERRPHLTRSRSPGSAVASRSGDQIIMGMNGADLRQIKTFGGHRWQLAANRAMVEPMGRRSAARCSHTNGPSDRRTDDSPSSRPGN